MSSFCCNATKSKWRLFPSLDRHKHQRAADPGPDEGTVAAGEHAVQIGGIDLDADEAWPGRDVLHRRGKRLDLGHGSKAAGIRYPAGAGDADQVDIRPRVARLPPGFTIDLVV